MGMEKNQDLTVQCTRQFGVPVERLYTAWTTEADLREWWQPMGNVLSHMTNELQNGGALQYNFEATDGQPAFSIDGNYKEVVPNQRLVYTWNWKVPNDAIQDSEFLLTIAFRSEGNGSTIDVRQENFISEESVLPHRQGWEKALEDLQQYLSK
jgi:uncharacterized protein YndB with AHSA1/START domain